jgi:phosphoesterase RecJ-like protein
MARAAGGTYEDTDGLVNMPLSVKEIEAVVFFKQNHGDEYRISLRSKDAIDVGSVAAQFGGGGHKNAAGCTTSGPIEALKRVFVEKIQHVVKRREGELARAR